MPGNMAVGFPPANTRPCAGSLGDSDTKKARCLLRRPHSSRRWEGFISCSRSAHPPPTAYLEAGLHRHMDWAPCYGAWGGGGGWEGKASGGGWDSIPSCPLLSCRGGWSSPTA